MVDKAAVDRSGAVAMGLSAINQYVGVKDGENTVEDVWAALHGALPDLCRDQPLEGSLLALFLALGTSSLVKALVLRTLLKASVSNWRWGLVWAAGPAVLVGFIFTQFLPEWVELIFGIPAILITYGLVIWKRGFGPEDRMLFRKNVGNDATADSKG